MGFHKPRPVENATAPTKQGDRKPPRSVSRRPSAPGTTLPIQRATRATSAAEAAQDEERAQRDAAPSDEAPKAIGRRAAWDKGLSAKKDSWAKQALGFGYFGMVPMELLAFRLPPSAVVLYSYIARLAITYSNTTTGWLSYEEIKNGNGQDRGCGLTKNTVKAAASELKQRGFLRSENDMRDRARIKTRYELLPVPPMPSATEMKKLQIDGRATRKRARMGRKRGAKIDS